MSDPFIDKIKTRFLEPLPGWAAQTKMAPYLPREIIPDPNARIACVLALLYPKNDEWNIVLIERMPSKNKNDRHSGQVSFPGGKYEPSDRLLVSAALRETEEEIGVLSQDISIIGQLSDMYIHVSNFLVHPFVGFIDYAPTFIPQPSEVKNILEVPIEVLKDPSTIRSTDMQVATGFTLKEVPYYHLDGYTVWGATAMMLSEFLEVISIK